MDIQQIFNFNCISEFNTLNNNYYLEYKQKYNSFNDMIINIDKKKEIAELYLPIEKCCS